MSNRIYFKRIEVDRMYGQPFSGLMLASLSKHINIVFGANASGKSTMAHAIQSVLLPRYARAGKTALDANLHIGTGELEIRVDGMRRDCRLDGESVSWDPELIRPKSYHISLHDLLSAEAGDQSFAAEIVKEASGGYDIHAAAKRLGFAKPSVRRDKLNKAIAENRNALSTVRSEHKTLAFERGKLRQLSEELKASVDAKSRIGLLDKALAFHGARQSWEESNAIAQQFPPILRMAVARNLDDTPKQLGEITDELARFSAELNRLRHQVAKVNRSIAASNVSQKGLADGFLQQLHAQIQNMRDAETRVDSHNEKLAGHRNEAKKIWESIADATDHNLAAQLGFADVQQLGRVTRRLEDLRAKKSALQALEGILQVDGGQDLEQRDDQLRQAQRYLFDWLRAKGPSTGRLTRVKILLLTAAVLSVVASVPVALSNPIGWTGLVTAALIVIAYILVHSAETNDSQSNAHKHGFETLGTEKPASWDREAVAAHLESLLKEHAGLKVDQEKQSRWMARLEEREGLEAAWAEALLDFKALQAKTGLKVATEEPLYFLVNQIIQHRRSIEEAAREEAHLHEAQNARVHTSSLVNDALAAHGSQRISSFTEAVAAYERLRSANESLLRNVQKRDSLLDQINGLEEQRKRTLARRSGIFSDLELPDGNTELLHRLVQKGNEFRQQMQIVGKAKAVLDNHARELRALPGFCDTLMSAEVDYLTTERGKLKRLAEDRDDLQKQITAIKTRIEDAEKGNVLEAALAAYDQSQAELEADRDEKCAQAVGDVLVQELVTYTRKQGLPAVFQAARKYFFAVTSGRYELRLSEKSAFRAYDTHREREHGLNELSSATRVQLLLCVRVAFVESQEHDNRFPLTLDEALANSDDDRAMTVIQTISALADRRQIIYFTAQQDEVRKWKELAGKTPVKVLKLGGTARTNGLESRPQY